MAITTFQPQKSSKFSMIVLYILAFLGVGLLVYLGSNVLTNVGSLRGKSALSVSILDGPGEVFLNGELLGSTPFDSDDVKSGENKIRVKNAQTSYDVSITFMSDSEVVLNRDLGVSDVFSSGQNFWIEKADLGTVLSIVSEPAGAKVFVDNTEVGSTPYSTGDLSDGEYELRIEKAGSEAQTARIKIQKGFKLNVVMKLFPLPVPPTVSLLEGADSLHDVYTSDSLVSSNVSNWVNAVIYWNETRGIDLSGVGTNKDLVFDYFVDYSGQVYDINGNIVTTTDELGEVNRGAYLRRVSDGPGLTDIAKVSVESLGAVTGKKAVILETGTGWLNVRETPSLSGVLVQKVNVGESYAVLEESTTWVKIKISDDASGWVSSTYVSVN